MNKSFCEFCGNKGDFKLYEMIDVVELVKIKVCFKCKKMLEHTTLKVL